ncbi:unnamed protein product [Sphagnum balticum]
MSADKDVRWSGSDRLWTFASKRFAGEHCSRQNWKFCSPRRLSACSSSSLICSMCSNILCAPTTLQCGHTFCSACVQMRQTDDSIECTNCQFVTRVAVRKNTFSEHSSPSSFVNPCHDHAVIRSVFGECILGWRPHGHHLISIADANEQGKAKWTALVDESNQLQTVLNADNWNNEASRHTYATALANMDASAGQRQRPLQTTTIVR